jgi:hypothetical protein
MDKAQVKIAEAAGFHISEAPGLTKTAWLMYYKDNGRGEVVKHRLPADPYSMERYLKKGFSLTPPSPKTTEPAVSVLEPPNKRFVCRHCGQDFTSKQGVTIHERKWCHKKPQKGG